MNLLLLKNNIILYTRETIIANVIQFLGWLYQKTMTNKAKEVRAA